MNRRLHLRSCALVAAGLAIAATLNVNAQGPGLTPSGAAVAEVTMDAVNTGFGDAYSAAAEVEYANGSTDTLMGKARAANGHAKPFGVKWWSIP
jgi:hypothetical protein